MSTPFSRLRSGKHAAEPEAEAQQLDDDPFFFGTDPATGEQPVVEAPVATHPAPDKPAGLADSGRLIDIRNVVKTYNLGEASELTVLHGVDFYADHNEFVSIVGPSGGGKSTLMNIIGMLDRPTEGAYAFNGEPVYAKTDRELASYRSRNIGFIFQNFNLIGRMDALQNVAMPMMYAGVEKKAREARAEELLALMGMGDRIHHNPNELSGGQKQRVAIARALANDPDLLLADEPTGALDSKTGRLVMDLFHQLHEEMGKAIVFITHNPELAEETQRIVEIMDGRISGVRTP